jgi:hypothetical protein
MFSAIGRGAISIGDRILDTFGIEGQSREEYQQELTQAAVALRSHVQAFEQRWNGYADRSRAVPEAAQSEFRRSEAIALGPFYQRMFNAAAALRRSMAKVRGPSQDAQQWRNTPLYREAYGWDQRAQDLIRRYQASPLWGYDTLNAGWLSRGLSRMSSTPTPTATEVGRAVGQAIGTAAGSTQATYGEAVDAAADARDRALREAGGGGDGDEGGGSEAGNRSWGLFALGLTGAATLIVGTGVVLGVKKRYKKNPETCRKLAAHRKAMRGR